MASDAASAIAAVSPYDRDMLIRTLIGEVPPQDPSAPAIAHVAFNRLANGGYGKSIGDIVRANDGRTWQFEPWGSRSAKLMGYAPTSAAYQGAAKIVDGVISGQIPDPTGSALNFYAPATQAKLGRKPPAWDDGTGVMIGAHKFFGGRSVMKALPTTNVLDDLGFDLGPAMPASAASAGKGQPLPATAGPAAAPPATAAPAASDAPQNILDVLGFDLGHAPVAMPTATPAAASAAPIRINDVGRALASGAPVIGGVLNKMDAGTNALLAPLLNPLFPEDQRLKGDTLGERYRNALDIQEGMDRTFAAEHPTLNNALNITGAIGGTIPLMIAAPGAFGLGGAGFIGNTAASAFSGGALNAADTALRSGGDWQATKDAAKVGGILGGLAPGFGAVASKGVNALANVAARTNPGARNIAGVLSNIGMTFSDADNALARMGPRATIADIDPALTAEARAVAAQGGAPTSILKNTMNARAASSGDRIGSIIDTNLGTRPDLTALKGSIQDQARADAAPFYGAAYRNPVPLNVAPLLSDIEKALPSAAGGVDSVLTKARDYLTRETASVPGPNGKNISMVVPKDDPQALVGVRQAIDDMIEKETGSNALRTLYDVRGKLDSILKTDPNLAAGDAAYAAQMRRLDALNEGMSLFKPGTRIEDVQRSIAGKSPEQIDAMRQGALSALHAEIDNARQGGFAAAHSLFGKSEANRAKLDALFPKASSTLDDLANEIAMRATEGHAAAGSATAESNALGRKYQPPSQNALSAAPAVIGEAVAGGPGAIALTAGRYAWDRIGNALSAGARDRLLTGTAKGFAAAGADRAAFMDQLRRAYAIDARTNALARGASTAANLFVRSGNALAPQIPLLQMIQSPVPHSP